MDKEQSVDLNLNVDRIICRVFWSCLCVELLIVFLDVFVNHYKWTSIGSIRRMLNITREDSFSNWFSSLQVVIVGLVVWMIAYTVKNQKQNNSGKLRFFCWAGIGSFFIYIGFDDGIKFHERIGTAFKTILERSAESSDPGILHSLYNIFPSYAWQMVFGPLFASIGIFTLWFLWKELSVYRFKYLVLISLCLFALAVGLDFVEGLDSKPYKGIAEFFSTKQFRVKHMSKALEEFLEMLGTTIFLIVFLKTLSNLSQVWQIKVVRKE